MGGGVGWVAHKILVTALSPNFLFSSLGLDLGLRTWPRACQFDSKNSFWGDNLSVGNMAGKNNLERMKFSGCSMF